eukprot:TRINITY_DN988_c0_g1_i1.p1 TRINITY_DN988_c0_g1~~TRINITY_DN988_c0_g1_i1.p1  ORF type:complete len:672 (+),score=140.94 TRINITY_DN988_c0_g1_i1:183-2198(+)
MESQTSRLLSEDLDADQMDQVLLNHMQNSETGVIVKDRSWLLKSYSACFVGKEAVEWFVTNHYAEDREKGVALGNRLMTDKKAFSHVTNDHVFKDEKLFYRFSKDEVDQQSSWADVLSGFIGGGSDAGPNDLGGLQPQIPGGFADSELVPQELSNLELAPLDEHNIKLLDNVHPPAWSDQEPAEKNDYYNLVVVGAGAAGLVSAAGAAGVGAKVALVEKHFMGGDCLNFGCVPSKALIRCANAVAAVKNSAAYGVKINGEVSVDFPAIMERMRKLRAQIAPNDSCSRFKDLGIDVFQGEGRFTSKSTVMVNGKTLKFRRAVIATGGRPAVPPIPGLADVPFLTNLTLFNLVELPKVFAVIGAGAIGCEMAQAFARFGSEVHLFFRSDHIMAREDADAAKIVEESMVKDGVILHPRTSYDNVSYSADTKTFHVNISVKPSADSSATSPTELAIDADQLLISVGRSPNVQNLGLEDAGVKYDARTGVHVSNTLFTSNGDILACGDVCTRYKFTHVADFQARIVIRNALFFGRTPATDLTIPWATYTQPEVGHVGLYEQDCEDRKIKYTVYEKTFEEIDRAILDGEEGGMVKVLVKEGTDKIIGATIVAKHAGDMISEITVAMQAGMGLGALAAVIHPYPTQADAIRKLGDDYNRTRLTPMLKVLFRKFLAARR